MSFLSFLTRVDQRERVQEIHTIPQTITMMPAAELVLKQLEDLQHADPNPHGASRLMESIHALLQKFSVMEQSLADRHIAEKAMRNVIANKDAEVARVRSEVSRLRTTLAARQLAEAAAAGPSCTEPNCCASNPAAVRKAVLEAATAAKDKPTAVITSLESQVSACQARIAALEAEQAAAAAENASRLSQQHKSFLTKLEQLRQVHSEQLAAEQEQVRQQQARCRSLEQQAAAAEAQQRQQQELVFSLQQQLQQLQQQCEAAAAAKQPRPAQAACGDGNNSSTFVCSDSGAATSGSLQSSSHNQQADSAVLQLMEGQLARLSQVIRGHEAELTQLRQALTAGVAERQQLLLQQQSLLCSSHQLLRDSRSADQRVLPVQQQRNESAVRVAAGGSSAMRVISGGLLKTGASGAESTQQQCRPGRLGSPKAAASVSAMRAVRK